MSPDSVAYLSAGERLASGDGLTRYSGDPLTVFPPLLPSVLSLINVMGFDTLDAARFLNAILFAMLVAVSTIWLLAYIRSKALVGLGTASILFAPTILQVHTYLWSEPFFILLTLLALFAMTNMAKRPSLRQTAIVGTLVSLAMMTRYSGFTLVPVAVVVLMVGSGRVTDRLYHVALFLLIALAPIGMWILHNLMTDGTLTGPRLTSQRALLTNINDALDTAVRWIIPSRLSIVVGRSFSIFVSTAVAVTMGGGMVYMALKKGYDRPRARQVVPLIAYVVIYSSYIVITASLVSIDPIGARLLSPIYVPVVLVSILMLELLLHRLGMTVGQLNRAVFLFAVMSLLIAMTSRGVFFAHNNANTGSGFTGVSWLPMMNSTVGPPTESDRVVFSNRPDVMYLANGGVAKPSPRYGLAGSQTSIDDVFRQTITDNTYVYMLWYKEPEPRSYLRPIEQLMKDFKFVLIQTDGSVSLYSVTTMERT